MEKPLKRITLSGKEYPIKCSNYVLALIQDEYGNLSDFETALTGKKPSLDGKGKQKKDDKGNLLYISGEPSVKAINFMLPLVVNEGIEIESELLNREAVPVKEKTLIRSIDIGLFELSGILREEFYKAVIAKK